MFLIRFGYFLFSLSLSGSPLEREEVSPPNTLIKENSDANQVTWMPPMAEPSPSSSSDGMNFWKRMMKMFNSGNTSMNSGGSEPFMDMVNRQMQMIMSMVSDMMGRWTNRGPMKWNLVQNDAGEFEMIDYKPYEYRNKRESDANSTSRRDEMRQNFEKYMQKTRETLQKSWNQLNTVLHDYRNQLNSTVEKAIENIRKQTGSKMENSSTASPVTV